MRKRLEVLQQRIEWIDTDNLYQAVGEIKEFMQEILELVDQALPKEVEPD